MCILSLSRLVNPIIKEISWRNYDRLRKNHFLSLYCTTQLKYDIQYINMRKAINKIMTFRSWRRLTRIEPLKAMLFNIHRHLNGCNEGKSTRTTTTCDGEFPFYLAKMICFKIHSCILYPYHICIGRCQFYYSFECHPLHGFNR